MNFQYNTKPKRRTIVLSVENDVVLGAICTILEWLSFWSQFIPSPFISHTCWHDTKMTFILKQVILQWVHSGFQSKWNSWSGMKFHSGINISWNKLCSSLKITNLCSLGQVAHAYLICHENHASENSLSWASQFYHVIAVRTLLWNETHCRMKMSSIK